MPAKPVPYALFPVTVEEAGLVTPHVKRVVFDAGCVPGVRADLAGQWVKVFVPGASDGGRAYTIRRFEAATGRVTMDFVLHGDGGTVSAWAAQVTPGAPFEVSHPHPRSGVAAEGGRYLLLGDETGLPAIAAILEALPAGAVARTVVEVTDAAEEQALRSCAALEVAWLHRGRGTLAQTVGGTDLSDVTVFAAAEAEAVRAIRGAVLAAGARRVHAAGYWKRGEVDHKDAHA